MFIFNDIELLMRLSKHRILDLIIARHPVSISAIRLSDYSYMVRKEIEGNRNIGVIHADSNFQGWFNDKRKNLSISDLSSIYITMTGNGGSLVLSDEDIFLEHMANKNNVVCLNCDDFIIRTIKEERTIQ